MKTSMDGPKTKNRAKLHDPATYPSNISRKDDNFNQKRDRPPVFIAAQFINIKDITPEVIYIYIHTYNGNIIQLIKRMKNAIWEITRMAPEISY